MKPAKAIVRQHFCGKRCPYKQEYQHPFWHHTAWCGYLHAELAWHDYWQAACITEEPDKKLAKLQGKTGCTDKEK